MILIVESGSSKTDWCLLDGEEVLLRISSNGLNPYIVSEEFIINTIRAEVLYAISADVKIESVYFYGSGCGNAIMCAIMEKCLMRCFPGAGIQVHSDMIAAARGLCGDGPGFVSILGTGSNSCAFEHGKIIEQVASLGFVLGDEGSGVDIGKKLLQAYCYKELGPEQTAALEKEYGISVMNILEAVYRKNQPNRFIASFVPFVQKNMDENLRKMVSDSFDSFFRRHLEKYSALPKTVPAYFTGSVSFVFRDILRESISRHGFIEGKIMQSPLEGLLKYHASKK